MYSNKIKICFSGTYSFGYFEIKIREKIRFHFAPVYRLSFHSTMLRNTFIIHYALLSLKIKDRVDIASSPFSLLQSCVANAVYFNVTFHNKTNLSPQKRRQNMNELTRTKCNRVSVIFNVIQTTRLKSVCTNYWHHQSKRNHSKYISQHPTDRYTKTRCRKLL
jgi:hypothetical protein